MKKILFIHGFYASGQCVPAVALKEAFEGRVEVITPDLPMHPKEAVGYIYGLIDIRTWYVPLAEKLLRTNLESK